MRVYAECIWFCGVPTMRFQRAGFACPQHGLAFRAYSHAVLERLETDEKQKKVRQRL